MAFKELRHYYKIFRYYIGWRLYIVIALTIVASVTEGLGITLFLPLLNTAQGTAHRSNSFAQHLVYQLLTRLSISHSLTGILIFIAGVFVLKGIVKFAAESFEVVLQSDFLWDLKSGLFKLYNHVNYTYILKRNTGHFVNVITDQVNKFYHAFLAFLGLLTQLIQTLSYFAIAFALSWQFSSMALVMGLMVMFVFRFLTGYIQRFSRKISSEQSNLNNLLVQGLQALKYIISTGQSSKINKGIDSSIRRLTDAIRRAGIAHGLTTASSEPIIIVMIAGIIIIQVNGFHQSLTPVFVSVILFYKGAQSLLNIQNYLQKMAIHIGAVEMVNGEFEILRKNQEERSGKQVGRLKKSIIFEDVSLAYQDDDPAVLKGINFDIPANATIALVGKSGAGKSTLADTLTLMLKPQHGRILIDGLDSRNLDIISWRKQIGYVSQETKIFDDTVANNISLWSGEYDSDETLQKAILRAAEKAFAHEFISELPDGYQTRVGDRGIMLSGGQRKRLFIARELFKEPSLLVLDEATSSLDGQSERYVQESIDKMKGALTVVIIAHRLSTVKRADQIYVLDKGKIIEKGSYEELLCQDKSLFKEMVEIQSL